MKLLNFTGMQLSSLLKLDVVELENTEDLCGKSSKYHWLLAQKAKVLTEVAACVTKWLLIGDFIQYPCVGIRL